MASRNGILGNLTKNLGCKSTAIMIFPQINTTYLEDDRVRVGRVQILQNDELCSGNVHLQFEYFLLQNTNQTKNEKARIINPPLCLFADGVFLFDGLKYWTGSFYGGIPPRRVTSHECQRKHRKHDFYRGSWSPRKLSITLDQKFNIRMRR